MAKHCIYCKIPLNESSVVDVCTRCGIGVWGEKMFAAILENMEDAREKGDLYQGSVTEGSMNPRSKPLQSKPQRSSALGSMAKEAIQTKEANAFEKQYGSTESKLDNSDDFSSEKQSASVFVDGLH